MNISKIALINERDILFAKYLEAYDMYESWLDRSKDRSNTEKERKYSNDVVRIMKDHLKQLSKKLVKLDSKISQVQKIFDLYTHIAEVN